MYLTMFVVYTRDNNNVTVQIRAHMYIARSFSSRMFLKTTVCPLFLRGDNDVRTIWSIPNYVMRNYYSVGLGCCYYGAKMIEIDYGVR